LNEKARAAAGQEALAEALPPLTRHEALVESTRCLMCYDAPCTHACPTHIDIPKFIKKINTGNLRGSARTILESNLLGASCARVVRCRNCAKARVCWVRSIKPIAIGRLQRYAMDYVYSKGVDIFFDREDQRQENCRGLGRAGWPFLRGGTRQEGARCDVV